MGWVLLQYKGAYDSFVAECTTAMLDQLRPRLARLAVKGNLTRYPVSEPLGDGLFELRARAGRVRMRLLYGFLPEKRIVIVFGTTKKGRVLPKADMQLARTLLAEAVAMQEKLNAISHTH